MPPIDPDNEQFVIYVRSKKGFKAWYPLNVVTGGSTANTLVKGLESNMSKDLALTSLTNSLVTDIFMPLIMLAWSGNDDIEGAFLVLLNDHTIEVESEPLDATSGPRLRFSKPVRLAIFIF